MRCAFSSLTRERSLYELRFGRCETAHGPKSQSRPVRRPWKNMAEHPQPNGPASPESSSTPTSPPENQSPERRGGRRRTGSIREQDRLLPIANVARIMKRALPGNAKISKDAKENVQECVSEFISFVTGEASDKCQRERRKTINGDDLLWVISTLGFENYVEPLKLYLHKYRELEGERSSMAKQAEPPQQLPDGPLAAPAGMGHDGSASNPPGLHTQTPHGHSPHGPLPYAQQLPPLMMAYHMPVYHPGTGSRAGSAAPNR